MACHCAVLTCCPQYQYFSAPQDSATPNPTSKQDSWSNPVKLCHKCRRVCRRQIAVQVLIDKILQTMLESFLILSALPLHKLSDVLTLPPLPLSSPTAVYLSREDSAQSLRNKILVSRGQWTQIAISISDLFIRPALP